MPTIRLRGERPVRCSDVAGPRETEFFAAVAPAIVTATRLAVRSEACGWTPGHPAIVVVGPRGELRAVTPAAREWQDRLDEIAPGRFMVMMQVMAVGARTAASDASAARDRRAGMAGRCRLLDLLRWETG